jgi:multiple sugar transport system permease protein
MASASATVHRKRRPSGVRLKEWRDGWLFASPFIIGLLFYWAGPMLYSLFLTTRAWDLLSPPRWIALGNFKALFSDPLLGTSLWNTAFYTFISVPLQLLVAFGLAMALNQGLKGQSFLRTIFYLPSITPAVAAAVVWSQIFAAEYGLLNQALRIFGIAPVRWLFTPILAKPAFIFMSLWSVGPQMVVLLAGLQNIPQALLEAAEIDGANAWARFRHVTLPMVSPSIFFNLVLGIIGSFQVFTAAFIMTRGGPQYATLFMVLLIYQNAFGWFKMGYAATLSWLLFAIIMVFTLIQLKLSGRWVYYEIGA